MPSWELRVEGKLMDDVRVDFVKQYIGLACIHVYIIFLFVCSKEQNPRLQNQRENFHRFSEVWL